jgi:hypothetical protein
VGGVVAGRCAQDDPKSAIASAPIETKFGMP